MELTASCNVFESTPNFFRLSERDCSRSPARSEYCGSSSMSRAMDTTITRANTSIRAITRITSTSVASQAGHPCRSR
jgi:hypothetical protein